MNNNFSSQKQNPLQAGNIINGRYKICERLSQGTFGETYTAEDNQKFKELVIVKRLRIESFSEELLAKAKELFEREARALKKLGKYPTIPKLEAYIFAEGQYWYLIMEYVKGKSLEDKILRSGNRLNDQELMALLREILSTLQIVHQHGLVHRDIKPNNLIIRDSDRKITLIDFGAVTKDLNLEYRFAHKSEDNDPDNLKTTIGNSYTAPEQMWGEAYFNTDIYAIGMIAIQILTGRTPKNFTRDKVTQEIVFEYLAPNSSPQLKAILKKMTCWQPIQRYQSVAEVVKDLNKIDKQPVSNNNKQTILEMDTQPNLKMKEKTAYRSRIVTPRQQNNKSWFFLWGGLGLLLFVVAGLGYWLENQSSINNSQDTTTVTRLNPANSSTNNNGQKTTQPQNTSQNTSPNTSQNSPQNSPQNPTRDLLKSFPKPQQVLSGFNLKLGGSVSMLTLNQFFKEKFQQEYSETLINIEVDLLRYNQGSDVGIEALCNGELDIAASSRPLSDNEPCDNLQAVQVGVDAVVIVVSKDVNLENLSTSNLQDIFRCENDNYFVIYGSLDSGTQNVFEKNVLDDDLGDCSNQPDNFIRWQNNEYTQRVNFMRSNDGKDNRTYITYSPYNYAIAQDTVKIIKVDGILPEDDNYPYRRGFYYFYKANEIGEPIDSKVKQFLGFIGSLN